MNIIKESLKEIKPKTWNACWKKVWSEVVHEFKGLLSVSKEVQRIVRVACDVGEEGFDNIQEKEVEALLQSHQVRSGMGAWPEQRVTESTFHRYSRGLRLAIPQADSWPIPISLRF